MKKQLLLTILPLILINIKFMGQTPPTPIIQGEIEITNFYVSKSNNIPFKVERQGNYAKLITFNENLEIDKQIVLEGELYYKDEEYGETNKAEFRSFETIYNNYDTYGLTARQCLFTQTLFNEDEKIEFLTGIYSSDGKLKRFEVISENGDLLTTYNLPKEIDNNTDYNYYYNAYTFGTKKYLIVEFYNYDSDADKYFYAFYPAEAGTSTNVKTYQPVKTMAYPNPVNRSEPLTIQLANPASTNTYVELFTINGTRAGRYKINEGEQQFSLPTTKLSAGQYIYHISAGGKRVDSGKVIVK